MARAARMFACGAVFFVGLSAGELWTRWARRYGFCERSLFSCLAEAINQSMDMTMNDNLNLYAAIISIISGSMTILGISGFLSWSFFQRDQNLLASKALEVMAYSIKVFMCIVLFFLLLLVFFVPWEAAVSLTGGDPYARIEVAVGVRRSPTFFENLFLFGNSIGTLIILLLFLPVYVIGSASIFTWSLNPFRQLWRTLSGSKD